MEEFFKSEIFTNSTNNNFCKTELGFYKLVGTDEKILLKNVSNDLLDIESIEVSFQENYFKIEFIKDGHDVITKYFHPNTPTPMVDIFINFVKKELGSVNNIFLYDINKGKINNFISII